MTCAPNIDPSKRVTVFGQSTGVYT